MADYISLVARLRAFEAGKAVRITSDRQIAVQPHALALCTVAMAGEDTTVHAVAVGQVSNSPAVRVIPDPRIRDSHYKLFEWLLGEVEPYFLECRAREDFPQIWVSSAAGIAHLDTLADRLRYNRDNAPARRLGELLSFSTERYPIEGQQALVSATGALRRHFATGQQEGEDEHLGAFLTWLHPPAKHDVHTSLALAELQPMGVNTDPEFDRTQLAPRLAAYNAARRRNAPSEEMKRRGTSITEQLAPVVKRIYVAVQQAYSELQRFSPREAALMAHLRQLEVSEFERFMQRRDANLPLPYRDKPKAAAFRIAEREGMIAQTEAGAIHSDRVARARAFLAGNVLRGTVARAELVRVGRRSVHRLEVRTLQRSLRTRQRDKLASLMDPRLRFEVTHVYRHGKWTLVALKVTAGMRCVGCPSRGASVELGPTPPDWDQRRRERKQMAARLAATPWTHTSNLPPVEGRDQPKPADLVADVESLP